MRKLSREEHQAARAAWRAKNGIVTEDHPHQTKRADGRADKRSLRPAITYPEMIGNGWQLIDGWRVPGSRL